MFVKKHFIYLGAHNSKSKCCYYAKHSAYYFYVKANISEDFQICISVPSRTPFLQNTSDRLLLSYISFTECKTKINDSMPCNSIENHASFFFLSEFSLTTIHVSQDCRGREWGGISLTPRYHFHPLHRHI